MVASGEQCVMTTGTFKMPRWCADSWAVDTQSQPQEMPTLALALAPSPWTTWRAQGQRLTSGSAGTEAGSPTIVATMKMLESFAQVLGDVICGRLLSARGCWKLEQWKLEASDWWCVWLVQGVAVGRRLSEFPLTCALQETSQRPLDLWSLC